MRDPASGLAQQQTERTHLKPAEKAGHMNGSLRDVASLALRETETTATATATARERERERERERASSRHGRRERGCRRRLARGWRVLGSSKLRLSVTLAVWGFLTNVERAVIVPTLFLYLKTRWGESASQHFYGLSMTAFGLAVLVSTPVYGLAAHHGLRVKVLLLAANQMEVIGNLLYLFAPSPWLVLTGRFVAGLGAGCEPPLYADLTRLTSKEERTPYLIAMLLTKQVGLIFGPACTLMMHGLNAVWGEFRLDVNNGPGLLMAVSWALHSLVALALYPNLDKNGEPVTFSSSLGDADMDDDDNNNNNNEDEAACCVCLRRRLVMGSTPVERQRTRARLLAPDEAVVEDGALKEEETTTTTTTTAKAKAKAKATATTAGWRISLQQLKPYLEYRIVVLLAIAFVAYFCLMALESALPPLANKLFNWTEMKVSYVYLGASILVIFVYLVLRCMTNCIEDRHLIVAGLITLLISYVMLSVVVEVVASASELIAVSVTLTGVAIHVIGMPFVVACPESLYTKFNDLSDMDRAQSIFRTVTNIAFLFGPFIGGSFTFLPIIVFLIMTVLVIFPIFFIAIRYRQFDSSLVHPSQISRPGHASNEEEEKDEEAPREEEPEKQMS
ncbi:unnamed protein product [Protopolystoma xenopodis]|uniref:Major facilitator superfamily (MFS) profile domain-containing protein n=1 Tax=Protopolystoma xenopodis TaxID=117903 RepID=A0A448WAX0_9PLAT|nr:unnamed protein product [Protopolystoma xenopodis]